MISEYIGSTKLGAAIQFVEPAAMGLPDATIHAGVDLCAVGFRCRPGGWFVHQVRSTLGGPRWSRFDG